MERRNFIQIISAFSLAPKVSFALPSAAIVKVEVAGYTASQYALGSYYMQSRGARTAADLAKWLQIGEANAQALMGDFISKGVVAPIANGVMKATNPYSTATEMLDHQVSKIYEAIKEDVIETIMEDDNETA